MTADSIRGENPSLDRLHDSRPLSDDVVNTILIRFYGLMRSGNHACISWIQNQFPGRTTCFLNNIRHGPCDPYKSYSHIELNGIPSDLPVESLRRFEKHLLIYSYEDRISLVSKGGSLMGVAFDPETEEVVNGNLLSHRYRFSIGMLRDAYNCFASRMQLINARGGCGGVTDMHLVKENWKEMARKAIELQENPAEGHMIILYNKWIASADYRRALSRRLMGTFSDNSLDIIPRYGGGSSFQAKPQSAWLDIARDVSTKWKLLLRPGTLLRIPDYLRAKSRPRLDIMDLTNRWRLFEESDQFRELFRDEEVVELSRRLFGEPENVRLFVSSL